MSVPANRCRRVPASLALAVSVLAVSVLALSVLALSVLVWAPLRAAAADSCPSGGEESAEVVAVEQGLELRLTDGRLLRLAGVDPAGATPKSADLGEVFRARLAKELVGKPVALRLSASAPDRWGRLTALVFSTDGTAPAAGIAAKALANGLGRYLAEPSAHACRTELLQAEAKARLAKLGLWADPYYAVLAVDDRAGFVERTGTLVLADGRLTAVQSNAFRTTLHFVAPDRDSNGGRMLVATIPLRLMKTFKAQQMDVSRLVGRRLRFRGLLDMRFGPGVELTSPDAVETLDAPNEAAALPHEK